MPHTVYVHAHELTSGCPRIHQDCQSCASSTPHRELCVQHTPVSEDLVYAALGGHQHNVSIEHTSSEDDIWMSPYIRTVSVPRLGLDSGHCLGYCFPSCSGVFRRRRLSTAHKRREIRTVDRTPVGSQLRRPGFSSI